MSEVKKCPKCGGELESGFIHATRGLFWDTKKQRLVFNTFTGTLISGWSGFTMPQARAWRCKKCELVVFLYGKNRGVEP